MSINITIPSGMENKLGDGRGMVWTPVIEDEGLENAFVVGPMQENLKNGDINKVPIMIGFNSEEELHFFRDDIPALIKFLSDEAFTTPLTRHAELQSNYTDVYLYQFSYKGAIGSGSVTVKDVETVGHFEELHYMWDFHDIVNETSVRDTLMHHRLLKLWTNFVKYLNPTPSEDVLLNGVIWPKVSPTNITYYDINTAIEVRTDPRRYKDWKPIIEKYAIPPLANY
ncbi:hypothetical protein NQ317_000246 [Molorchus minor]|uniref:Carboxylesterase type B domain-containing protein n=1 Tax=Molorchus minor TaxID=1323400 RepID=A0ABQ9JSY1_9CUCU|nr:hypothetical protein NQ317_000246 [Molorchus minor]